MVKYSVDLPKAFLESMHDMLGDEYDDYLSSLNQSSKSGIRINTLKTNTTSIKGLISDDLKKIPWIPNGFFIDNERSYSKHPYYFAGLYYIQEPSAMTPASVLGTQPGDRVLDLCAAPGGKSTQIGADLCGSGILISNDISSSRAKALLKNIELFGIGNCHITTEAPEKLSTAYPDFFDRILIDAPCSGEGMFRKSPGIVKYYNEKGPKYYAAIQSSILDYANTMLKPGGTIVYSTCTFSKIEDEENIIAFLERYKEYSIDPLDDKSEFSNSDILPGTIRLFPHKCDGEGHYVCRLKKAGTLQKSIVSGYNYRVRLPESVLSFLSSIHRSWDSNRFYMNRDYLYYLPEDGRIEDGIRYLRTGLLVGIIKNERFEPSQALAMNLQSSECDNPLNLTLQDERIIRYLKGETIISDDEYKGFRLLCVDGYPLGWIKQDGYKCKNKYLPGWRWM